MGHIEYLCRYVDFDGSEISLRNWCIGSSRLVLESIVLDVVKSEDSWTDLYEAGAFTSMMFRLWKDVQFEELSVREKGLCGRLSNEMVLLSDGVFYMGGLESDASVSKVEKPRHQVTLSNPLYVGTYAVTQGLWEWIMGKNPSKFKGAGRPVEQVSWTDCVDFCNRLSKHEGFEAAYLINGEAVQCNWNSNGYRLPTEAEWEYAAQGGVYQRFSGSQIVDEVAWYDDNSDTGNGDETHPVGQKAANGFGLYDMSGNVYEWVWDVFQEYSHLSKVDPKGPRLGTGHVFRGGCWLTRSKCARVSFRAYSTNSIHRGSGLGFRMVRTPKGIQ